MTLIVLDVRSKSQSQQSRSLDSGSTPVIQSPILANTPFLNIIPPYVVNPNRVSPLQSAIVSLVS